MDNRSDTVDDCSFVPEECTYPTSMENYQLMEQVGSGMGGNKVFKAVVLNGGHKNEIVAIKQISLNPIDKDDFKDQMQKEISAMRKAASAHVCVFHCSLVAENYVYVIMKLAAGSLKDVLRWKYKTGFPDEEEKALIRVLHETIKGLDVLHNTRIIHRDIKAGNILYDCNGSILLADFGVSAILQSEQEKRKTMAGTWHWMAPEVINPEERGYDSSADIWSLGITVIELAYGEAPYAHERPTQVVVHISTDEPPSMSDPHTPHFTKAKFSAAIADFTSCCLQVDPTKRSTTTQLLAHKLFTTTTEISDVKRVLIDDMPPLEKRFAEMQDRKNKLSVNKLNSPSSQNSNRGPTGSSKRSVQQNRPSPSRLNQLYQFDGGAERK